MPNDDKPTPPQNRPAQPTRREPADEKPTPPPRATRIVEETGRYVCKRGITFADEKGQRASARKGDVVAISPDDAKHLKRVGAVVEETREE